MGWYSASLTTFTYNDYLINGKYCASGLAFPILDKTGAHTYQANCTATDRIFYNGTNLTYPYPCDPTQQNKLCQLFYNASQPNDGIVLPQMSFTTRCNCGLNGTDNVGYCAQILGT